MAATRITLPSGPVRAGSRVDLQLLIAHPMDTGYRADDQGQVLPRNILRRFSCHYLDQLVVELDLFPAIAANPYLAFSLVALRSGPLRFRWEGDQGFVQEEERWLEVQA
jgi:sulfur-oxidizing protein SoxZ